MLSRLSLRKLNLCLSVSGFVFGKRIHKGPEHGSNLDLDPQH